ncbi:hypothetical protein ACVW19_003648 [Streptomyces sp. TE5632]
MTQTNQKEASSARDWRTASGGAWRVTKVSNRGMAQWFHCL